MNLMYKSAVVESFYSNPLKYGPTSLMKPYLSQGIQNREVLMSRMRDSGIQNGGHPGKGGGRDSGNQIERISKLIY